MSKRCARTSTSTGLSLRARRLLAASSTLALIVFFVLGFAFHAWAIAWVAFLIPGLLTRWYSVSADGEDTANGTAHLKEGYGATYPEPKPYPYE